MVQTVSHRFVGTFQVESSAGDEDFEVRSPGYGLGERLAGVGISRVERVGTDRSRSAALPVPV